MTQPNRPKQVEFKSRVMAAMDALEGYPGAPRSLGQLADDAGVTPPNLASALSLRRAMTWNGLKRLHRALKLDALGLELSAWDDGADDPSLLARLIKDRRRGDPVELALANAREPFFGVAAAGAFMGVRPVRSGEPPRTPGVAVYPGQSLEITLNPPVDGFVKIICREGAEFFSLDAHLNLSHRRFKAGTPVTLDSRIDVEAGYYGETVFVGLASADAFQGDWPRDSGPGDTVNRETCADLFRGLFERPGERWGASVFSVWTLPETMAHLS